jgi:hypothetical protein
MAGQKLVAESGPRERARQLAASLSLEEQVRFSVDSLMQILTITDFFVGWKRLLAHGRLPQQRHSFD